MAKNELITEGVLIEDENNEDINNENMKISNEIESNQGEAMFEHELSEEKDSILENSFLYKNLIKDV